MGMSFTLIWVITLTLPPLVDCYLAVVEGLVCLRDPANSAGRGLASGRCNQAGKINGERPDKRAAKKKKHLKTLDRETRYLSSL